MIRWMMLLLFGLSLPLLYGQTTVTTRYTTADGLIANDVRVLLMDSKGMLWIGSRAGLSVKKQGRIVVDDEALKHRFTNITSIVEDGDQGIWAGSYGQGILYRGKTKTQLFNAATGLDEDRINCLAVFDTKLYIGTSEGISIIDIPTLKIETFSKQHSLATPSAVSSFYQKDHAIYATTINHGVFKVEAGQLHSIGDKKEVVASFFDPKRQELLLGLKFALEIQSQGSHGTSLNNNVKGTRFFQAIGNKVFWVSADILNEGGGIYAWDGHHIEKLNQTYGIENTDLYSLAYDSKRNFLYVGTKEHGLYQVDLGSPLRFDPRFGLIDALVVHGEYIHVFGAKGWCVVHQNKIVQTKGKEAFKSFQLANNKPFIGVTTRENNFFEIEHRILANQIKFYKAVVHADALWVSTNIGFFQLTLDGQLKQYAGIHTYQFDFFHNQLVETDPYGGVRVYDDLTTFDYQYFDRSDGAFVPRDIVDMKEVEGKLYLAGALDGLYVYENNQFRSLYQEGVFVENRLKHLKKGDGAQLYVATDFGDVYCLDLSDSQPKVKFKIEQESILGHGITFLEYVDHQLYIGTNVGGTVLDNKGTFLFNKEQGLDNYAIKSSGIIGPNLVLGTEKGLYTLDRRHFNSQPIQYNLVISSVKVNETLLELKQGQLLTEKKLVLPNYQNSIFVDFVLLGAKYPDKLKFQYRVKPTEQWINLEQPSLTLHYLNAGKYPIEIRIYDYNNGSEQIELLLDVTIKPPFYYSWWFFSVVGLVVIGIVMLIFRRLKRQQEIKDKQLRFEKKVAELKVLSVRSQLNTHFIFNVLSSFQYFIIAHKEEEALYYLERFASLIRKTLNLSMVEQVSVKDEIDYIEGYFELENMRLDERVQLEITVEKHLNLHQITIPPLLLQPFVENSLVHAFPESIEHPKLHINIYQKQADVILEVIDNGIGNQQDLQQRATHESKGLYLVKERMKMIQAYLDEHLTIQSTETGTRVRLVLKDAIQVKN
ncbi:histidine kinase [Myroides sp. NP-2]|uniref:sensor histidine kinase n=1 Tax=Myroides sp. NP-2 TaxID=2759945 RepID=UPI0015FDB416|nr:histidine kinase [Myroides sp. NP-2]MBB1150842.1 histidine kinase [Myroides sp. NP-2]